MRFLFEREQVVIIEANSHREAEKKAETAEWKTMTTTIEALNPDQVLECPECHRRFLRKEMVEINEYAEVLCRDCDQEVRDNAAAEQADESRVCRP